MYNARTRPKGPSTRSASIVARILPCIFLIDTTNETTRLCGHSNQGGNMRVNRIILALGAVTVMVMLALAKVASDAGLGDPSTFTGF